MAPKHSSTSGMRETDRLLQRIRALVQQTSHRDGSDGPTVRAQKREIEHLKSQLAEMVKRNPTGTS
jgi:hypothetical protein